MKMNLPNKLTLLRVILVPFFVFFALADFVPHHNLIAGLIFGAASYTDHLDGKIARRDNLITNFGKLMDPLADKIMVMAALICFVACGFTNVWFVLLIIVISIFLSRRILKNGREHGSAHNRSTITSSAR